VKVRTWPHFSARVIFANFAATKLSLSFDMVVNSEGLVLDVSVSNSREFMSMWFRGLEGKQASGKISCGGGDRENGGEGATGALTEGNGL
jgi:hypothetical protein